MTVLERRIDNILKAMREAKDYEMKSIWNRKLQELFNKALTIASNEERDNKEKIREQADKIFSDTINE